MKQSKLSIAVKATLLGASIALAPAAFAADKELLDILKANGSISADEYTELSMSNMMNKSDNDVTVSLKGGHFKIKSDDGAFKLQIGGRIMADYASVDDDRKLIGDASEIRRARLFVKGKLFNDWGYKAQYDFAGDEVTVKDMYLQYNGFKSVKVTLGNQKAPFGLEELTSSKYITFMERSTPNDIFAVGRKNGLNVATHGDNWTLTGMVHMDGIDNNNAGQDEDYGYGARVTFAPLAGKTQAIHLGASFHHQEYDDGLTGGGVGTQKFRARPEIHTSNRPYETKIDNVEDTDSFGLEFAGVFGPASFQSEYFEKSVNTSTVGGSDVDLDGYYAYASYFLTGESRTYKAKKGAFSRVKPNSVVGKGGIGAWELGIRYSSIDLNDGVNTAVSQIGEEGDVLTVGVNWYATPNIRFMANYVMATVEHPGTLLKDDDIDALQFRAQVDF